MANANEGELLWVRNGEVRAVVTIDHWVVVAGRRYGCTPDGAWIPASQLRGDATPDEDRARNRAQGDTKNLVVTGRRSSLASGRADHSQPQSPHRRAWGRGRMETENQDPTLGDVIHGVLESMHTIYATTMGKIRAPTYRGARMAPPPPCPPPRAEGQRRGWKLIAVNMIEPLRVPGEKSGEPDVYELAPAWLVWTWKATVVEAEETISSGSN